MELKINFERFKSVFVDCNKNLSSFAIMPKNKKDYAEKLYQMYIYGRNNREEEILHNIKRLIIK